MEKLPPLRKDLEDVLMGIICDCAAMGPSALGELLLHYEDLRTAAWNLCRDSKIVNYDDAVSLRKALEALHVP